MNTPSIYNIELIAATHNAAILTDRDGDMALQARIYDSDGVQQVRHRPDPCDFIPLAKWQAMTAKEAARHIC